MKSYLSDQKVNTGRQKEVDLAKVFAIITMIFVHVLESLTPRPVMSRGFFVVSEFLGGPLSAPIFITAMGVGLAYSRNQDPAVIARRGLVIIGQGYLLNLLRGGLVYLVAWVVYRNPAFLHTSAAELFDLDIFHFAGLSFILFALLKKLKATDLQMFLLSVGMLLVATFAVPFAQDSIVLSGVVGYFFYQHPDTSFPLFSWFVYPVVGYLFGKTLQRVTDKPGFYRRLFVISGVSFAVYTLILWIAGQNLMDFFMMDLYYQQTILSVPWILLISGMLYSVAYVLSTLVSETKLGQGIHFMSDKLNQIYMVQWVLIRWAAVLLFYGMIFSERMVLAFTLAVLVASVALVYGKTKIAARAK